MKRFDLWLRMVLYCSGVVMLLAAIGLLMPAASMARVHERLGLGRFPDGAITVYLARVTSALYMLVGGLAIIAARDIRKYKALITYLAFALPGVSVAVAICCATTSLPWWWLLEDVVAAGSFGVITLSLQWAGREKPVATASSPEALRR